MSTISPSSVYVGGPAYTIQVSGSGFTNASKVLINGNVRSTTYVSSSSLTAQVLASDIADSGQANVQVTTPAPGGGTSDTFIILINTQIPTVTVTPASLDVTTTQSLKVTVSVSGVSGYPAPTGSVALSTGIYSTAATLSAGSATLTLPAGSLPSGTVTLNANYAADTPGSTLYRNANGQATVSVGVANKVTPTVSVTPSASSITTAQGLTLNISVSGGSGNPTPTGYLSITVGSSALGSPSLNAGSATFSIAASQLPVGKDTVSVSFSPDSVSSPTYNSSTGAASVTVTAAAKVTPTVSVTPSASSITTAQALTVAVAVSGSNGIPTGTVSISGGGFTSSATTLSAGSASINIPAGSLATGTITLTSTYTPDTASSANYTTASGSATVTVTASTGPAHPTVTVTPSVSTITDNQPFTVAVTVVGIAGQATPTGSVTLASGSYTALTSSCRRRQYQHLHRAWIAGSRNRYVDGDLFRGRELHLCDWNSHRLRQLGHRCRARAALRVSWRQHHRDRYIYGRYQLHGNHQSCLLPVGFTHRCAECAHLQPEADDHHSQRRRQRHFHVDCQYNGSFLIGARSPQHVGTRRWRGFGSAACSVGAVRPPPRAAHAAALGGCHRRVRPRLRRRRRWGKYHDPSRHAGNNRRHVHLPCHRD